jgi:hypothetical protein
LIDSPGEKLVTDRNANYSKKKSCKIKVTKKKRVFDNESDEESVDPFEKKVIKNINNPKKKCGKAKNVKVKKNK